MFYQLKRPEDLDWFDLFHLEDPQEATHTISQMAGPHYQGQAVMQIISGLENAVPAGALIDEKTIKELLDSGQFFLVPYSGAKSPMLRQIATVNTSDTSIDPSKSEWQLSSNTYSEHLTSALNFLKDQTSAPTFAAAVIRQKADPSKPKPAEDKDKNEKEKPPEKYWLKIQSLFGDKWNTPLPLTVEVLVDGVVVEPEIKLHTGEGKSTRSSNLKKAQQSGAEPGTILLDDIPSGVVEVRVKRIAGEEQAIASLKKDLVSSLESGYREIVAAMKPFREQWDEYGYLSLAMSKIDGAFSAGDGWLEDQAELFDGETWEKFGASLSDGLNDALDFTASYIPEAYDSITKTIEETLEDIDENSDNLTSWNWWKSEVTDTVGKTIRKVKTEVEDAGEFLDDSADMVAKLYKHKSSILNLPKQVAKGDAISVQNFVDTILKDIDSDLSKQIKDSPDFYMVLELIADHDSALTYFSYMDMFLEAVPPNFYAYISGKAGVYVLLEIVLFIVLSFLTLGVGVAARLTMLAAKMTATSVRVAKKLDKAEKAQDAVKGMIGKFSDSADTLKKLGEKLAITRSAGRSKAGFEDSTLSDKKDIEERESKCRFCSGKHNAPESLNGWVEYR